MLAIINGSKQCELLDVQPKLPVKSSRRHAALQVVLPAFSCFRLRRVSRRISIHYIKEK